MVKEVAKQKANLPNCLQLVLYLPGLLNPNKKIV